MPNNVEGYKFIFDLISELAAAVSRVLGRHNLAFLDDHPECRYTDMPGFIESSEDDKDKDK